MWGTKKKKIIRSARPVTRIQLGPVFLSPSKEEMVVTHFESRLFLISLTPGDDRQSAHASHCQEALAEIPLHRTVQDLLTHSKRCIALWVPGDWHAEQVSDLAGLPRDRRSAFFTHLSVVSSRLKYPVASPTPFPGCPAGTSGLV